jgi:glycosyltransferase involved in cell wall biosynthesis
MKVLIVTPHVFAGGAEKVVLHSAQKLELMGCDVAIASLSLDISGLPQMLKDLHYIQPKKNLLPSHINGSRTVMGSMVKESYALSRLLRKHAKDIDILNPFNFPAYWATFLAQTRKPVVWTCSEVLGPYRQTKELYEKSSFFRASLDLAVSIDKYVVKHGVDEIVTYSKLNSQLIMERYGRTSKVIPACVDFDFFSESLPGAKEKIGFQDSIVLLHVGWLVPSKNHIISIRALHLLKKKIPNIKLIIVGTGLLEHSLKNEADRLGLKDDVVFRDANTQKDLRLLYQACDLNLYPVRNQTFGLVPFEVLAAGKPSIVSDECGAADVIGREKIGFLIKPNVKELVDTVLFALKHDELVEDVVQRGKQYVRENLTWDKYSRDMYDVFRSVLRSEHK